VHTLSRALFLLQSGVAERRDAILQGMIFSCLFILFMLCPFSDDIWHSFTDIFNVSMNRL